MDFIFKVMVQQSRTGPSLISWLGGFTYQCQSKRLWNVQVTSQLVTIRMLNLLCLFDPLNDLDPEKKLFDLHIFDGASVCRKAKNIEGCLSHDVMYCWSIAYLP